MGGDPVATALYNALSATFPKGEAFFVESVRAFRDGAPPKLAARDQGVHHPGGDAQPRACRVQQARARGRLRPLAARGAGRLSGCEETKGRPPIVSLAATMALEHFTAILAHQLLGIRAICGRRRRIGGHVALARDRGDRA